MLTIEIFYFKHGVLHEKVTIVKPGFFYGHGPRRKFHFPVHQL